MDTANETRRTTTSSRLFRACFPPAISIPVREGRAKKNLPYHRRQPILPFFALPSPPLSSEIANPLRHATLI